MKKLFVFVSFFFLCILCLAELPVSKPDKILLSKDKNDSLRQLHSLLKDTIPYLRKTPDLVSLKNSRCDAGVLKDLQPLALYGADAICFQPGGMHPAKFKVEIYLSADKKDRLEIIIFDDVRKLRKKNYTIQANGPKSQPSIKLFVGDKPFVIFNKAIIKLNMLVLRNNTFSLLISEATRIENQTSLISSPTYDVVTKGIYLLQ